MFGDLAHADHVATVVPGMDNNLDNFDAHLARDGRALESEADGNGVRAATIAWLGYDTPNALPAGADDVTHDKVARSAGFELRNFMADLNLPPDTKVTVIGHSYGSLVTGWALRDGLQADNVVVIGSPGIGVDRLGDLHLPEGTHFYAGRAVFDYVGYSQWFGQDPADARFGATRFETGRGDDGLVMLHSDKGYFMGGSESLANLSHISRGEDDKVTVHQPDAMEEAVADFFRGEHAVNASAGEVQHDIDALQRGVDRALSGTGPVRDIVDFQIDAEQWAADAALRGVELPMNVGMEAFDRAAGVADDAGAVVSDAAHDGWHAIFG